MSIYELLGLPVGSSVEDIEKKLKIYEKVAKKYNQAYDKDMLELINTEYNKCMKDKASYDKKIRSNGKIFILDEYREENKKLSDEEYLDSLSSTSTNRKYKVDKTSNNKPKKTKGLSLKKLFLITVAGTVVFVGLAFVGNKIDKNTQTVVIPTTQQEYGFDYIVKPNDTVSGLKQEFDASRLNYGNELEQGEEITIYTDNEAVALENQAIYDEQKESEKPVSFESYTIKPGDNLPDIANMYGVTCSEIIKYNDNVPNISTIYAGDVIQIPVYEKVISK